eukprot:gene24586-biopygen1391
MSFRIECCHCDLEWDWCRAGKQKPGSIKPNIGNGEYAKPSQCTVKQALHARKARADVPVVYKGRVGYTGMCPLRTEWV